MSSLQEIYFSLALTSESIRLHKPGKWLWVEGMEYDVFSQHCQQAGEILWTTRVSPKAESPALVVSNKALRLHTDHHRADVIAWYCHEAAETGGETLLLDLDELYATLNDELKSALARLHFHEHQVFPEDKEWHPFYVDANGRNRFYYSFWPAAVELEAETQAAYEHIQKLIAEQTPVAVLLQPRGALFIDNTRVLHGRTSFSGTGRHLERNWIRLIGTQ